MRTNDSLRRLDLGTQSPAAAFDAASAVAGSRRGVLGRWRLAGLLGVFGTVAAASALSGCVSDPDCGVCDPDNLIIESIAGVNYAGKIVKLLGPECEGAECPGEITSGKYFVEKIIPCVQTEDALEAPRGVEEWCKVSPLIVDSGVQFIFNNLLDPTSVELVRKRADNPQLMEVFDWKTHIVHLEGPITRFNGDYRPGATATKPDLVTRSVNLACIENLAKQGIEFNHTVLDKNPTICDGTYKAEDGKIRPLKLELERKDAKGKSVPTIIDTYDGETETRLTSQSCTPPQNGADTCCDACDYELSVNVAKYGISQPADELTDATKLWVTDKEATSCDPMGDKYKECAGFITHVYRGQEVRTFEYDWNGDGKSELYHLPMQDKLRETHPDDRPEGVEQKTVPCNDDQDCTAETKGNLPGTECVGRDAKGNACAEGDDCTEKRCVAEWFVDCRPDAATTGAGGLCVDKRWSGAGAAACYTTDKPFYVCSNPETCPDENFSDKSRIQKSNSRFSLADADFDGVVEAIEGCPSALGGEDLEGCDPFFQPAVHPIDRYDRKDTLPTSTRNCVCEDEPKDGCQEFVDKLCREGGEPGAPIIKEKKGQYAIKFVRRTGGVIYDPAIKGVQFLPADLGNVVRSFPEACSALRPGGKGAGGLNIKDGWRANDTGTETYDNFDRAMCSSSDYKVVFETPPEGSQGPLEYIRDKVGNTLAGKSTYTLHTPDFHVVPGSGFPTDNLRIGACDDFEIRFSNKYDLSALNLRKLQLVEITPDVPSEEAEEIKVVAGGIDCSDDPEQGIPCLTTNVRDQEIGAVRVSIDTQKYGADVLVAKHRYRLKVPGLTLAAGETVHDVIAKKPDEYARAFWDACGMPLVTSMPHINKEDGTVIKSGGEVRDADYFYDFNIDEPKPKEDKENDNVQFSCDNAPDDFNPDQADMDGDGFGDIVDLCPTVPTDNNTADTDKDGIGNQCDRCTRQPTAYNKNADDAGAPVPMMIRNIPSQIDTDEDGIGDVCDNCIVAANCGDFGPKADGLTPAGISSTVPFDKDNICQTDNDAFPFIGDACIVDDGQGDGPKPIELPGSAGPVGLGNADDFDQDGLPNLTDRCPRQRVENIPCTDADDCGGAECTGGICNHIDTDNDGVGDICDTCPAKSNPKQIQDGGMQADDPDSDFVGNACETNSGCYEQADARRIAFYTKSANGQCCVTTFTEDLGLTDPGYVEVDEMTGECKVIDPVAPLSANCSEAEDNKTCRLLPKSVIERPGVVTMPAGCEELGEPLTLDSPEIKGNEDKLYTFMCLLPQVDQDFDGIGDPCDLCPYAFDPDNSYYKDDNNKVWPNYGKFCRGRYDPEKGTQTCEDVPDTDTGTGTGGMESSGGTG